MNRAKILVVDDDVKILKVIKRFLEREGYEISTASSGAAAIKVIPVQQPDLLILDLMMPNISGSKVIEYLAETNQSLPVIVLSAKGDTGDRINGLNMGVDDYLSKPFSPLELMLRIKAVLRRVYKGSIKGEDKVITHDGLLIDMRSHKVIVDGREVSLTGKEFELLVLLASNPRQVFTRHELIQKIWQSDYEGDETTVTVHIRRLREKIEKDSSNPKYIQTVWGTGYRLDA